MPLNDESIANNMLSQLIPGEFDQKKSVEDAFYDYIGYDNPAKEIGVPAPEGQGALTSQELEETAVEREGLDERVDRFARVIAADMEAADYEEKGAFLPAFAKAVYATENFGDNIETMVSVHGTRWALENDHDWLARFLASDTQFGITYGSTRGGNYGFYAETVPPEEIFGEDWRTMAPDEMYKKIAKNKAESVEKYYGDVEGNRIAEAAGWAASNLIVDATNLAPTGYITLAAKFGKLAGKTTGKVTAGAITGAAWGLADQAAASEVREQAQDPIQFAAAGALGAVFGGALPIVGQYAHALFNKMRRSGVPTTAADLEPVRQDHIERAQRDLNELESIPLPKEPKEKAAAEALTERAKLRLQAIAELDLQDIADAGNKHTISGKETDVQRVIDASIRFHEGHQTESMDVHKFVNKADRINIDDELSYVVTSKSYSRLPPEQQEQVDTFIRIMREEPPKIVNKKEKVNPEEVVAQRVTENAEATNSYLGTIAQHGKAYKAGLVRSLVADTTFGGAVGGGSYVATGDEDFAIQMGLAAGLVAAGSQIGRKLYAPIDDVKQRQLSPDPEVRMAANKEILSSRAKQFLSGQSPTTTNNWTTTPAREWAMRGGVGKTLGRQLEKVSEDVKIGINNKLISYSRTMAENKLSRKDSPIVARLLTHQKSVKDPDVTEAHIKAAKDIRKLLNAEVRAAQKAGVLTKSEADNLIATAKKEGYLNRVYYTDYLATKKGAKAFADALNALNDNKGMKEKDALSIIASITGEAEKEAMLVLTNTVRKTENGEYLFDAQTIRQLMLAKGGVVQTNKFLERGRKLPTHLEQALDPFLVRDLQTALIKYFESTTSRIEHVKAFGKNNEGAAAWRELIDKEWGVATGLGKKAEQDILGAQFDPRNEYLKQYFDQSEVFKFSNNIVQHWQNAKLIASGPLNFTQHLAYLPTLMTNMGLASKVLPNMLGAYKEGLTEISKEVARRGTDGHKFLNQMGTMVDSITYSAAGDMARLQPNRKMGVFSGIVHRPDFWLRVGGFEGLERWNRRVAGLTGKAIVDDTIQRKAALEKMPRRSASLDKELSQLNERMVAMGLNPEIPITQQAVRDLDDAGTWIANDLLRDPNVKANRLAAAQSISNKTNFQSDYMNKPRMWNTPLGMWFGKFRNFLLHNTAFVRDEIIKPMTYGDMRPAAMMIATASVAGAGVSEFREFIRNDDVELSATRQMFENMMIVGALGGWIEAITSIGEHPQHTVGTIVGPVASDVWKYGNQAAGHISEGHVLDIAGMLVTDFAAVKQGVSLGSRLTGEENPYAYKGEQAAKERSRALGL